MLDSKVPMPFYLESVIDFVFNQFLFKMGPYCFSSHFSVLFCLLILFSNVFGCSLQNRNKRIALTEGLFAPMPLNYALCCKLSSKL